MRPFVVVTGGSSGLGKLLMAEMIDNGYRAIDWSSNDVDVAELSSCRDAARNLVMMMENQGGQLVGLINCAGINFIDWIPNVLDSDWDRIMDTNAKGIFNTTKSLIGLFAKENSFICNIISNASHVPMTHSIAYNASKGAAAIMTRQMARELKKTHNITVFGVSPNKMRGTGMSAYIDKRVCELRGWTPEQAREYQLQALPAGEETDPEIVAEFIGFLLSSPLRYKYLNGCDLSYGA